MNLNYRHLGITKTTRLIMAVSGGPDSVCLLYLLKKSGFKNIIVAHLDHKIRQDSYRDAQLVKEMAEQLAYKFAFQQLDIRAIAEERGENLEAFGRQARYAFFRELKEKNKAEYIVTAHHSGDQVETILLNIIRGCGLEGLAGMRELDHDLWRPLLSYSKKELFRFCGEQQLRFVNEATNLDPRYSRNYLRLKVIPLLQKLNPKLLETFKGNIKIWQEAVRYFENKAKSFLDANEHKSLRYDLKVFLALDNSEQQVILRELYHRVHGSKKDLMQSHLEQILKVLRTNVSGKQKEFGPGKVVVRGRQWFEIKDV